LTEDLKREVSMGLVSPRGVVNIHPLASNDIIGEDGYFDDKAKQMLNWNSIIQPHQIFEIGEKLHYPTKKDEDAITGLVRFDLFLSIFLNLLRDEGIVDHSFIRNESESFINSHLEYYVKNDEDWLANASLFTNTKDEEDFKFSGSPFLFQGACYLDKIIIPNIYKKG
jgi:hypothetical protein